MNETRDIKVGDKVIVNPDLDLSGTYAGRVFEVVKLPTKSNEVNATLEPVHGGRRLKARPAYLRHAPADSLLPQADPMVRFQVAHPLGTVVRFQHELHVVIGDYKDGTHKICKLGGSDRYYTHVPHSAIEVVPVEEINA